MAEGFAHQMGWQAFSAGTKPETKVNPFAVKVMEDIDIDISHHIPESVNKYLDDIFDIIATVCGNADETCPEFTGTCKQKIYYGFIDPAIAPGNNEENMEIFRNVRDEIWEWVKKI